MIFRTGSPPHISPCRQPTVIIPDPVHLNVPFSKPLLEEKRDYKRKEVPEAIRLDPDPRELDIQDLIPELGNQKGLLIAGRDVNDSPASILKLAERLGWLIIPDIQSQLRFSKHPHVVNMLIC